MNTPAIESCISSSAPHQEWAEQHSEMRQIRNPIMAIAIAMLTLSSKAVTAMAQVNRVGARPYLGWSTYSEQTIVPSSSVMSEQNMCRCRRGPTRLNSAIPATTLPTWTRSSSRCHWNFEGAFPGKALGRRRPALDFHPFR